MVQACRLFAVKVLHESGSDAAAVGHHREFPTAGACAGVNENSETVMFGTHPARGRFAARVQPGARVGVRIRGAAFEQPSETVRIRRQRRGVGAQI